MKNKIWAWCLYQLTRHCDHPPRLVTADILSGDMFADMTWIQWCRLCGAYRRGKDSETIHDVNNATWTVPRPDWWF